MTKQFAGSFSYRESRI